VADPKHPDLKRSNERCKTLNPQRILVFNVVPGGGSNPHEVALGGF
jgi:hypothetical protein